LRVRRYAATRVDRARVRAAARCGSRVRSAASTSADRSIRGKRRRILRFC